jgi:succinyl-CoA synthetase beta subunit
LSTVPSTEHEAKQLLTSWGLPVAEGGLARDGSEAADLADRLGGRVVMKVVSPDVIHKTEAGGVVLGVSGPNQAREAFDRIVAAVSSRRPDAHIDGIRVERMQVGVEVIVGAILDPVFGPTAVLGLGGVAVEGLGAERFAPAPLTPDQALRMVTRVPGLETMLERRHAGDQAIVELAGLVTETSRRFVASGLGQLEMNPVTWTGERWEILDAVMVDRSGG